MAAHARAFGTRGAAAGPGQGGLHRDAACRPLFQSVRLLPAYSVTHKVIPPGGADK